MNWDQVEGKWEQRRAEAECHWGRMMNDDLAAGKLQERYGIAKQQVDGLKRTIEQLKKPDA